MIDIPDNPFCACKWETPEGTALALRYRHWARCWALTILWSATSHADVCSILAEFFGVTKTAAVNLGP